MIVHDHGPVQSLMVGKNPGEVVWNLDVKPERAPFVKELIDCIKEIDKDGLNVESIISEEIRRGPWVVPSLTIDNYLSVRFLSVDETNTSRPLHQTEGDMGARISRLHVEVRFLNAQDPKYMPVEADKIGLEIANLIDQKFCGSADIDPFAELNSAPVEQACDIMSAYDIAFRACVRIEVVEPGVVVTNPSFNNFSKPTDVIMPATLMPRDEQSNFLIRSADGTRSFIVKPYFNDSHDLSSFDIIFEDQNTNHSSIIGRIDVINVYKGDAQRVEEALFHCIRDNISRLR